MGKVIFIVTHDFEFVCRTCSRVLHFDEAKCPMMYKLQWMPSRN